MLTKSPIGGDQQVSSRNHIPFTDKVREKAQSMTIKGDTPQDTTDAENSSRKKKVIIPKAKNVDDLANK
jgi:hypothetical protein